MKYCNKFRTPGRRNDISVHTAIADTLHQCKAFSVESHSGLGFNHLNNLNIKHKARAIRGVNLH